MTNEAEAKVRKTVTKVGMKYPIALTKGTEADEAYGVTAVPRTFLVDRAGRLVWTGHPVELDSELIERLLAEEAP